MTILEKLIQELCPNGIEYKSIKAIAEVVLETAMAMNQ